MASLLAALGGLWFPGAALLNVAGGDEVLSFPRVIYVGLALIAFALVDWDSPVLDRPAVTLSSRERERPSDD
jgi:hypothetical protein